tara:strand:- start:225 stop:848 length:624 start_codon:yes stop_codon:yes gene_type:complete
MNNIYKILFFISIFIIGCKSNVIEKNKVVQKIESLDMNVFSMKGDKIYSISSPKSNFDKIQLKFNLEKTTINIFNGEDIKYIINSDSSTLSDKNKIVELIGNVELRTLNQENDFLYGDNLIWNIEESVYELMGNIKFENKNILLFSSKAKLGEDNIIEFFNPVKYIIKDDNNENKFVIKSQNAFYNLNTESISFQANDKRVRSIIYF